MPRKDQAALVRPSSTSLSKHVCREPDPARAGPSLAGWAARRPALTPPHGPRGLHPQGGRPRGGLCHPPPPLSRRPPGGLAGRGAAAGRAVPPPWTGRRRGGGDRGDGTGRGTGHVGVSSRGSPGRAAYGWPPGVGVERGRPGATKESGPGRLGGPRVQGLPPAGSGRGKGPGVPSSQEACGDWDTPQTHGDPTWRPRTPTCRGADEDPGVRLPRAEPAPDSRPRPHRG